ncbi:MAG: iron-containing alcohol dehydrogenase [Sedimentisphaerales bacterium]|jgi:alcohol dehydrogenase class IV|nr:iron-containing alcohol dehydrogenase [Sedimentisphaerales bacterium]
MRFEFATANRIVFGPGVAADLPQIIASLGDRPFVLTGGTPEHYEQIVRLLTEANLEPTTFGIRGEPTTETVSAATAAARQARADVVVGIGGGSAIDSGKAVAAMLTNEGNIEDYLEVVGLGKPLKNRSGPYVAVPTTAGTGAEVTRNAVLLVPEHRVKVSMRSPFLLPEVALVDPLLTHSMAPDVTAATGLDALTQLIEAFVTKKANPLTDGICREGLRCAARSLRRAFEDGADATARQDMALAALFSGLALANAGLGAVHGFAGSLGGMIGAPHGVVCGRLLPHVMAANVKALRDRVPDSPALARFDEIAQIATGDDSARASDGVVWVKNLCGVMALPGLRRYGLTEADFSDAVAQAKKASSMKGNPIELHDDELAAILTAAMD